MLIQCTKKLLDELNVIPCEKPEEDTFFSWHANLITVNRKKAVVLMNNKNNYVILIFGLKAKDFKILGEHILNAVRDSFQEECIKDEVINMFINKSNGITYSKTSSRSIISKLNNVCSMLPHFEDLLDYASIYQSTLSVKFSQMPVKAGTQKYIFPYEELYKDLGTFVGGSIFAVTLPKVPEELNMD